MTKSKINLTLFSDDGAIEASGVSPQTPTENIGSRPAADTADSSESTSPSAEAAAGTSDEMTYEQLIRSDKYRDSHAAYMRRVIEKRFKKLDRVDAELARTREALTVAADKLGVTSEGDDLAERVISFARDKDVGDTSPSTPSKTESTIHPHVSREEYAARQVRALVKNGRSTKEQFPGFDLTKEMRDEGFVKLLMATGGDTTAAYVARHHGEILGGALAAAEARGMSAVESSLKRNRSRPIESPLSGTSTAIVREDPSSLSLQDFRRIRDDFRRTGKRASF